MLPLRQLSWKNMNPPLLFLLLLDLFFLLYYHSHHLFHIYPQSSNQDKNIIITYNGAVLWQKDFLQLLNNHHEGVWYKFEGAPSHLYILLHPWTGPRPLGSCWRAISSTCKVVIIRYNMFVCWFSTKYLQRTCEKDISKF